MKKNCNYLKLLIILIVIIFVTIISCNLYKNYDGNKANKSYISKYVLSINYGELKNALVELSSNTFIYLSTTGNKKIYNMEKDLKKIVKNNNLEDNFIYVDVTEMNSKDNYLDNINATLGLTEKKISNLPAIVYFKDNVAMDFIESSANSIFLAGDFKQMIDAYEITTSAKHD